MSASTATGASDAHIIERSAASPEEFALIFDRHEQIAHAMDVPVGTVRSRLHRTPTLSG